MNKKTLEKKKDDSNQGLAENCDPGSADFTSQVEIPNEVSRQAIQDAVNGVGMQTVNSIDDLLEAMDK